MMLETESHSSTALLDRQIVVVQIQKALRDTLFTSSQRVTPRRMNEIGQQFADAFLGFLDDRRFELADVYGHQLAVEGLSPRSVLAMTEALRRTCWEHSNPSQDLSRGVSEFSNVLLEGYIAGRETALLEVQERTHRAYLAALEREQDGAAQV